MREFPLTTGPADYLLFVDRKAIGVVEAKPEGTTLSGVEVQSARYSIGLGVVPLHWHSPLPSPNNTASSPRSRPSSPGWMPASRR